MKTQRTKILLSVLLLSGMLLFACAKDKIGTVDETGGVGRVPIDTPLDPESGVESESDSETETDPPVVIPPVSSEPTYWIENGKYVYAIPAMDRTGLNDLSDVKSMSRALFEDAGTSTDWFYGKVERNLTTGEVTVKWDRYASTLALLDKYDAVYRKNEDEKVVYFTFDCGYENGWTDPILDVLKEKNVPGLFFVVGHYVNTAKPQIQRMLDEGHLVGTHTYNHPNCTTITEEKFISEITSLEDAMQAAFPDAPPMIYYRPPYGACNEWTLAMAKKMGLTTVLWSWAHLDYLTDDQPDPVTALEKAKKGLHNGAVYLFHCVGSTNPAILGDLIDYIRAEGYEIRPMCG